MPSTEKALGVMSDLVKGFSSKSFPEMVTKAFIVAPDTPSAKWSWNNRLSMILQGTNDARGYKQWGEVGRYPKKGSKAIYILGPRLIKIKDEKDPEKKDRKQLIGFRAIPVFRYEDTDGSKLEEYEPKELPPLIELAEYNNIDVRYVNSSHGEYGSMNRRNKRMTLSTESPDTFLHELMHFYDLKDRDDVKSGQDKTQEIVAQLGACVLCHMYGYDAREYTWNYISAYSNTEDPEKIGKECIAVVDRVGKAITAILEDAEKIKKVDPGKEVIAGMSGA